MPITTETLSLEQLLLEKKMQLSGETTGEENNNLNNDDSIHEIVGKLDSLDRIELLQVMAEAEGIDFIDLSGYVPEDKSVPLLLGEKISRKFEMLAIKKDGNTLVVAMKDPKNIFAIDSARLLSSMEVRPVLADGEQLKEKLDEIFSHDDAVQKETRNIEKIGETEETEKVKKADKTQKARVYREKIGQMLLSAGAIDEAQLEKALEIQKNNGGAIGTIMIQEGFITKEQLYPLLEEQTGIPYCNLEDKEISDEIIKMIGGKLARKYGLIPIGIENEILQVAMSDPLNIYAIDDLRLATGCEIKPLMADRDLIASMLDTYYKEEEAPSAAVVEEPDDLPVNFEEAMEKVREEIEIEVQKKEQVETTINISDVENAPIVRMLNMIFKNAIDKGASDIHIEAWEDCVMVRFRIDGQLVEVMKHDKKLQQILVARVKIISGLNIAEKRLPQDGRVALKIGGRNYDFRVSVLPTIFGEKVVIRIMDKDGFNISKTELGFFDDDLEKFDKIMARPHGIVLVTGPTGSGKSTTLYTALRELSKPDINIMTVEDPVESTIRGVNQVQVNIKAGMTFASALRSFLRQDPDIIMVGEIRDGETAEIAIRAAITGHLVLSTLHTNDSVSSISRLMDMGIEPFLIASSLEGVIAQRLVRRLCPKCREGYTPGEREMEILKLKDAVTLYKPVGCPACNGSGYKGRIAVYEILTVSNRLKEMISQRATAESIKKAALDEGMRTLAENCTRLVESGVTSLEEMISIVSIN